MVKFVTQEVMVGDVGDVQQLIEQLIINRPDDPVAFLIDLLNRDTLDGNMDTCDSDDDDDDDDVCYEDFSIKKCFTHICEIWVKTYIYICCTFTCMQNLHMVKNPTQLK